MLQLLRSRKFFLGLLVGLLSLAHLVSAAPSGTDSTARRTFSLGVAAYNNSTFFGRSQTEKFPYLETQFTYKAKSGLWASVLNDDLFSTATLLDETDLSAGWDWDYNDHWDGSLSYSHFFFSANSPLLKSAVSNSIDGYTGVDWGFLYTRLNADYVFGSAHDVFLVLDNSRYFEVDKVLSQKAVLSFEPKVSLTAGTESFAVTSLDLQQRRKAGKPRLTTVTKYKTRFDLQNAQFRLPVTYSLGKFSLEGVWRFIVPLNTSAEESSKPLSIFSVGAYLTF